MIECKDVRLSYRKKQILRGVDFVANPGAITAILGKNGSGKSSLVRCIAGNRHHCTGQILLGGAEMQKLQPAQRAKILSSMPQILPQPPITVANLVSFGRQPYLGYGGRILVQEQEKIDEAMRQTEIVKYRDRLVSSLSGGERQIAFFTMLIAQDTPIVLLDEPTANLDAEYSGMVYDLLRQMRRKNKTIVIVMHDLDDAVELADIVYVMEDGDVCFKGEPQSFVESTMPRSVFGVMPIWAVKQDGSSFVVFKR